MKPKWLRMGSPAIYIGKCYGFQIIVWDKKMAKKPYKLMYGSSSNEKQEYKIVVYRRQKL